MINPLLNPTPVLNLSACLLGLSAFIRLDSEWKPLQIAFDQKSIFTNDFLTYFQENQIPLIKYKYEVYPDIGLKPLLFGIGNENIYYFVEKLPENKTELAIKAKEMGFVKAIFVSFKRCEIRLIHNKPDRAVFCLNWTNCEEWFWPIPVNIFLRANEMNDPNFYILSNKLGPVFVELKKYLNVSFNYNIQAIKNMPEINIQQPETLISILFGFTFHRNDSNVKIVANYNETSSEIILASYAYPTKIGLYLPVQPVKLNVLTTIYGVYQRSITFNDIISADIYLPLIITLLFFILYTYVSLKLFYRGPRYTLTFSALAVIGLCFGQQTFKAQPYIFQKVGYFGWTLFVYLNFVSGAGNLVAFLSVTDSQRKFNSFAQLNYSSSALLILDDNYKQYPGIREFINHPSLLITDRCSYEERIYFDSKQQGFLMEDEIASLIVKYSPFQHLKLYAVNDAVGFRLASFLVRNNSILIPRINNFMVRIFEAGLFDIFQDWNYSFTKNVLLEQFAIRGVITSSNLLLIVGIYLCIMGNLVLVFLCEVIYFHRKKIARKIFGFFGEINYS